MDVLWQPAAVSRVMREQQNRHKSFLLWFTGLSGAGKSTLAHAVEERLHQLGLRTFVLDGDNVRHGLCKDLGFSEQDRVENIRRVSEVAKLFLEAGVVTLTSFISPFRLDREKARSLFSEGDFLEVYCRCPLEICEVRDVKGLYQRARAGQVNSFTGITSPYEEPLTPELIIDTNQFTLDASVNAVLDLLRKHGVIQSGSLTS